MINVNHAIAFCHFFKAKTELINFLAMVKTVIFVNLISFLGLVLKYYKNKY